MHIEMYITCLSTTQQRIVLVMTTVWCNKYHFSIELVNACTVPYQINMIHGVVLPLLGHKHSRTDVVMSVICSEAYYWQTNNIGVLHVNRQTVGQRGDNI